MYDKSTGTFTSKRNSIFIENLNNSLNLSESMIKPVEYNIGSNKMKTEGCSEADRRSGLCRLLMIQMMFGITYGGNCPYFRNYPLKKVMLIIYDMIVIISFGFFEYFAFNGDVFTRLFSNSSSKGIMCILFKFAAFSLAIEFLAIKVMLLKDGWNTIHAIKNMGAMNVSTLHLRLVILFLAVMALMYAVLFPVNFTDLNETLSEVYSKEKVKTIGFLIVGIFYSMNKFSITSLLLFISLAIKKLIQEWTDNLKTCNMKVQTLCESILELRTSIEEINSHIGLLMFIKVFVNAMLMPSTICSIYVGALPINGIVGVCLFAIASLTDISVLCYSSQIMIDAMSNLCKEVEKMLILKSFDDSVHKQLYVILSMKKYIRIKVFCLFDLKTVTVLAIIGYVTNYAIILIQTTITEK